MTNDIKIRIKRDDGSLASLVATPQFNDDSGGMVLNGVYDLASESIPDIGQLAFHLDDKHQWEYCGDILTDDEIEQVVLNIQPLIE